MIASLRGTLVSKDPGTCLIEAGGVGYELSVPGSTWYKLPEAGQPVHLLTYFHVREDAQQLYGFGQAAEKQAFTLLLTVKGVGPRLALAILSGLSPVQLKDALKKRRLEVLTAVSGVGKKLAERLAVELSDKADALVVEGGLPGVEESPASGAVEKAVQALQSLGYGPGAARTAVQQALADLGRDARLEALVRAALKVAQ
jgi:Holliday junction DNA helicase RuvA